MSVTVNTNYGAIVSQKNLAQTEDQFNKAVERISSGKKTSNARDDAAGVAIAGKMERQIRGLSMAINHTKEGQSLAGAAEGALAEVRGLLQRMREIAVNAASGTASNSDKDYLNLEMSNLVNQIENISVNTKFNQNQLLRGQEFSFFTDIDIQGSNITTVSADMAVTSLGVATNTVSIGGGVAQAALSNVVSAIDGALGTVDDRRANFGALSNRFDHIIANLQNVIIHTERSKGVIMDADFAAETGKLASANVLMSGGTSMLANANAQKKLVLTLFNQQTFN